MKFTVLDDHDACEIHVFNFYGSTELIVDRLILEHKDEGLLSVHSQCKFVSTVDRARTICKLVVVNVLLEPQLLDFRPFDEIGAAEQTEVVRECVSSDQVR